MSSRLADSSPAKNSSIASACSLSRPVTKYTGKSSGAKGFLLDFFRFGAVSGPEAALEAAEEPAPGPSAALVAAGAPFVPSSFIELSGMEGRQGATFAIGANLAAGVSFTNGFGSARGRALLGSGLSSKGAARDFGVGRSHAPEPAALESAACSPSDL